MVALISALWLGILTSISPCPLATNIAAISFLSKHAMHPKRVFWSGIAYTVGRMLTYAVLGAIIIASLVSVPFVANFLQRYMNKVLGPILVFVGLFLLDAVRFSFPSISFSRNKQNALARSGAKGAFVLGIMFALSFCPISAALFFGSLIPLSLNHRYGIMLPFVYGVGTGLPVIIFAAGITLGVLSFSYWFYRLSRLEFYTRKATGVVFILVGCYYTWAHLIRSML